MMEEGSSDRAAETSPAPPPAPTKPDRIWPVFVSFAFVWLHLFVGSAILTVGILASRQAGEGDDFAKIIEEGFRQPWALAVSMLTFSIGLLLITFAAAGLSRVRFVERLNLSPAIGPKGRLFLVGSLFVLGISQFAGTVLAFVFGELSEHLKLMQQAVQESQGATRVMLWFAVGAAAPVVEELYFRGYVQTRLVRSWGAVGGVSVSALLFGLMHYDPQHILAAFAMGLGLGYIALVSGSVWPAIVAHAVNNAIYLATSAMGVNEYEPSVVVLMVSIFIALPAGFVLRRIGENNRAQRKASSA